VWVCFALQKLALSTAEILGHLVKLMGLIGLIGLVWGIPYSNSVLFLYGGSSLANNEGESSSATKLLQANCAYISLLAVNGVTEAFSFAAMTKEEMDK
jgi:oligosaccharide translocation protein RFT1